MAMYNSLDHEEFINNYMKEKNIRVEFDFRIEDDGFIKHITVFYDNVPVWLPVVYDKDGAYVEFLPDYRDYILVS
jgi:hypothetical protein